MKNLFYLRSHLKISDCLRSGYRFDARYDYNLNGKKWQWNPKSKKNKVEQL